MNARSHEIKASHHARKAAVYIRQSSEAQVVNNVGSTDAQRAQRRYAEAWGWSPELIEVIDDDLGLSGSAAGHRPGYQRLVKDIGMDLVGAVLLSDESRLGRETVEKLTFANLCIRKKVLLVLNGRVADLADPATLMQAQMTAVFSEHENLSTPDPTSTGDSSATTAVNDTAMGRCDSAKPRRPKRSSSSIIIQLM